MNNRAPYNVQLFDDLHNYLPALLYNPEQFNTVRECLEYIQERARSNFNLYDRNQRNHTGISSIEERYNRRERIIQQSANLQESNEQLLENLLNDFINNPVNALPQQQQPNIMTLITSLISTPLEPIIQNNGIPSVEQINHATQCISTTVSSEICTVCHESLANSEVRRINHCSHMFHQRCINRWFQQSSKCPVCRHDIQQ